MASRGKKAALAGAAGAVAVLAVAAACWKDIVAQFHLVRIRKDPEYLYAIADRPEGSPEARAIARHLEVPSAREAIFRECVEMLLREPLEAPDAGRLLMVAVGVPTREPSPGSGLASRRTTSFSTPFTTPGGTPPRAGPAPAARTTVRSAPRIVRTPVSPQARVVVTGNGQAVTILDGDSDGTPAVHGHRLRLPSHAEYVSTAPASFVVKPGLPTGRLVALGRILARLAGRDYRNEAFPRFRFRVMRLEDLSISVPYAVANAMFPIGATLLVAEREPEDAAHLLLRTLTHMNSSERAWAARALGALGARGALGTEAAAATRALEEALGDPVPEVRSAAEEALGNVRGGRS